MSDNVDYSLFKILNLMNDQLDELTKGLMALGEDILELKKQIQIANSTRSENV